MRYVKKQCVKLRVFDNQLFKQVLHGNDVQMISILYLIYVKFQMKTYCKEDVRYYKNGQNPSMNYITRYQIKEMCNVQVQTRIKTIEPVE